MTFLLLELVWLVVQQQSQQQRTAKVVITNKGTFGRPIRVWKCVMLSLGHTDTRFQVSL
jgi:hypothetical protein